MKLIILLLCFFFLNISLCQVIESFTDTEKLNNYLIQEVNAIRKKAKQDQLNNNKGLELAAQDHATYMLMKKKLTHDQRGNRLKHSPKNRADFYESGFAIIGENVQKLHLSQVEAELKKNKRIDDPYAALAKLLAENWRKSPPHYANMIHPSYLYTYSTVAIDDDGNIYACQLFGGSEFVEHHKKKNKRVNYKPVKEKKCKRKNAEGYVFVDQDGTIIYAAKTKRETGFRWAWPFKEGIAADIVLKSQYPCGENNSFHPEPGIKGIPLTPVYKKDFRKVGTWEKNRVVIPIGKVPDYIDEPFEVNLTIISRKRTCGNIHFNRIASGIEIGLNLKLEIPFASPYRVEQMDSLIEEKVYFQKSGVKINDTSLISPPIALNDYLLDSTVLVGYASIEGDFEKNKSLFEQRTKNVKEVLISIGHEDDLITETAAENYGDFRRDIADSKFADWVTLSDSVLKQKVSVRPISDSLEAILANHRYVAIHHFYSKKDSVKLAAETLEKEFIQAIQESNYNDAELAQLRLLQLVKSRDAKLNTSLYDSIPRERQFATIKFYFDLFHFENQRKTNFTQAVNDFMDSVGVILNIDPKNRMAHAALAFFEAMKVIQRGNVADIFNLYQSISENKLIDRVFQARLLIELGITHDLIIYQDNISANLLIEDVANHIRKAKLSVSELFGVSAYFNYFGYQKYAFDLVKRVYLSSEKSMELNYFTGLVLFRSLGLNEKQKQRYFESIAKSQTSIFCDFFTNGAINFQLFDDLTYKTIYCYYCHDVN